MDRHHRVSGRPATRRAGGTDTDLPLQTGQKILRRRDLEANLRLSRSTIYEKITPSSPRYDPSFPKPIRLGSGTAVGWLAHEVEDWLNRQIEISRTPSP